MRDEFISLDKPPASSRCKSAAWSTQNSGSIDALAAI